MAQPDLIIIPFAEDAAPGYVDTIPDTLPPGSDPQYASWSQGFPPVTMTPLGAGGIPPRGQSFNGVLNAISEHIVYIGGGGQYKWNADYASVNGYQLGAIVQKLDNSGFWRSTVEGNTTNPDLSGAGWVPVGLESGRILNIRVFDTPGTYTYTETPGTNTVLPLIQGAGAGGGGVQATGAGQVSAAFGGQGGTYAEGRFTSAFSGVTITVGAKGLGGVAGPNTGSSGGSSSFGGLLSCPGGVGGVGGTANTAGNSFGLPGPVSAVPVGTATRKVRGQGAGAPSVFSTGQSISGAGGSSFSGVGGQAFSGGAGVNAINPGSGGGGAAVGQSSGSAYKGGDGADGFVIVVELS